MEYLLEEAENNNLPVLKKRAIIKEYLQIIILNSIYKQKFGKYVLKANDVKLPIEDTLVEYFNGLEERELKQLANQVRPFLFKEDDIDLVMKAPLYGKAYLDNYADGIGK